MDKMIDDIVAAFNTMRRQNPLPDDLDRDNLSKVLMNAKFLFDGGYSPPSSEKDTLDELAKALKKVEDLLEQGDDKVRTPGDINFVRMSEASDRFLEFAEDVRTFRELATRVHIAKSKDGKKPNTTENERAAIRMLAEYWDGLQGRKYSNEWINTLEPKAEASCFIYVVTEKLAPHVTPRLFNVLKEFKI